MPEAVRLPDFSHASKSIFTVDSFLGLDLTGAAATISKARSPDAPNMIPDAMGNPVKRTGYELLGSYDSRINGRYTLREHEIIHAGTKIYIDGVSVYTTANDAKSAALVMDEKLYLFDGKELLCCNGSTVTPAADSAYIPTVLISKHPSEYTTTETFTGNGTTKEFTLSAQPDSIVSVTVGGASSAEYTRSGTAISFKTAPSSGAAIVVTVSEDFTGNGTTKEFNLSFEPDGVVSVKVGGTTTTAYTRSGSKITFTTAPSSGAAIIITVTDNFTGDGSTKVFTLSGTPDSIVAVSVGGTAAYRFTGTEISFGIAVNDGISVVVNPFFRADPAGTQLEAFNLIQPKWTESFQVREAEATAMKFELSKTDWDDDEPAVKVRNSAGEWETKVKGTDYTVDSAAGVVTFLSAPGAAPVTGEDNVTITARKTIEGYADRINKCTCCIAYSVGATQDRIFASGNPDMPDYDWHCTAGNATYWPDTGYHRFGQGDAAVIGYSIVEGYLATHIRPSGDGRSMILRYGSTADDGDVTFPIYSSLQGEEAVAPRAIRYMETEPLFLTARGVYAITPADIDGREYTQNRSYFINKQLCAEAGLSGAEGGKWKQYFLLAVNGKLYLLDTSQKSYTKGAPQSTYQYECYLWTGIDARILWEEDGRLYFGDSEGRIFGFYTDATASGSYSDYDGDAADHKKAISAYWTLPDFTGTHFYKNKSISVLGLQLAPYPNNAVTLEYYDKGVWGELKTFTGAVSYLKWSALCWSAWNWLSDTTAKTVTVKAKLKKRDKVPFRIKNDSIDSAFGLYAFSAEFTETGRYKS